MHIFFCDIRDRVLSKWPSRGVICYLDRLDALPHRRRFPPRGRSSISHCHAFQSFYHWTLTITEHSSPAYLLSYLDAVWRPEIRARLLQQGIPSNTAANTVMNSPFLGCFFCLFWCLRMFFFLQGLRGSIRLHTLIWNVSITTYVGNVQPVIKNKVPCSCTSRLIVGITRYNQPDLYWNATLNLRAVSLMNKRPPSPSPSPSLPPMALPAVPSSPLCYSPSLVEVP